MKKLGLAIATAAALSCAPALAADLRPVTKAPAAVAPVVAPMSWTGLYIGGSIGHAWEDVLGAYIIAPPNRHDTSGTRVYGGAHIGLQYQFGMFVLGAEAAWSNGFDNDWNQSFSPTAACLIATPDRTCQSRLSDIFQVGGRLGLGFERFLIYGTGGFASARLTTRTIVTTTGVETSITGARHDGWYIGGGVEVLAGRLSFADVVLGLEYQHIEFETVAHAAALAINDRFMTPQIDIVKARLSLKFNPFGSRPVMASY